MSLDVEKIIAGLKNEAGKCSNTKNDNHGLSELCLKNKIINIFFKFFKKSNHTFKSNYYKHMPMYTDGCRDHIKAFNASIQFDKSLPLAIVIPWFGEEIVGGAEKQSYELAYQLAQKGFKIEVLTTCSKSFRDEWSENFHEPGSYNINGLQVKRFLVDSRNKQLFDENNKKLLSKTADKLHPLYFDGTDEENLIWKQENINSSSLNNFISEQRSNYNAFIFLPYLYGITLKGVKIAKDKAWLQPCLHNESYAYLQCVKELFINVRGIFFNSHGEQQLAANIYGPTIWAKGIVVGEGITFEKKEISELPHNLMSKKFILYLGRRCNEKNTNELVKRFTDFRKNNTESSLQLVLAGPGQNFYYGDAIIDLGEVTEEIKNTLLSNCLALVQPSVNESFSRVIYEAWFHEKPVIVNQNCLATTTAVNASRGGLVLDSNWSNCFAILEHENTSILSELGKNGNKYRKRYYTWEKVIKNYELAFSYIDDHIKKHVTLPKTIYQILPNLAFGDAVSNEAIQLHKLFKCSNINSIILSRKDHIDDRVRKYCKYIEDESIKDDSIIIYHYSIGSEIDDYVINTNCKRIMRYHGITPHEFFWQSEVRFQNLLRNGKEKLWELSSHFEISIPTSQYTKKELELYGFNRTECISLPICPSKFNFLPDRDIINKFKSYINFTFVGRFAPNKGHKDLILLFSKLKKLLPNAHLSIIGSYNISDNYYNDIVSLINILKLNNSITISNHVSDSELTAHYMVSDYYLCASMHEGFGVPIIEAMWFDLPVICYNTSSLKDTLDGSGILIQYKNEIEFVKNVHELCLDIEVSKKIIQNQRERRILNCTNLINLKWIELIKNAQYT